LYGKTRHREVSNEIFLKIDDIDLLGKRKVRDFLRKRIFQFKLVASDFVR